MGTLTGAKGDTIDLGCYKYPVDCGNLWNCATQWRTVVSDNGEGRLLRIVRIPLSLVRINRLGADIKTWCLRFNMYMHHRCWSFSLHMQALLPAEEHVRS
jgi:hypothetical protein